MIEGFRLQFTSDELKTHLKSRIDYHNTQIEVLSSVKAPSQVKLDTPENRKTLYEAFEIIRQARHPGPEGDGMIEDSHSEKMVENILAPRHVEVDGETQERIARHRNTIDLFSFYASRLASGETYRLDLQEVMDLEIFGYADDSRPIYKKAMISPGSEIRGMQKLMGVPSSYREGLKESVGTVKSLGKRHG
jgi:hypothetical protein